MFVNTIALGTFVAIIGILVVKAQGESQCGQTGQTLPSLPPPLNLDNHEIQFQTDKLTFEPPLVFNGNELKDFDLEQAAGHYFLFRSTMTFFESNPSTGPQKIIICMWIEKVDDYYAVSFSGETQSTQEPKLYYTQVSASDPVDFCKSCTNEESKDLFFDESGTIIPDDGGSNQVCMEPECCPEPQCPQNQNPLESICKALRDTIGPLDTQQEEEEQEQAVIAKRRLAGKRRWRSKRSLNKKLLSLMERRNEHIYQRKHKSKGKGSGSGSDHSSSEEHNGGKSCNCPKIDSLKCVLGELLKTCWKFFNPDLEL